MIFGAAHFANPLAREITRAALAMPRVRLARPCMCRMYQWMKVSCRGRKATPTLTMPWAQSSSPSKRTRKRSPRRFPGTAHGENVRVIVAASTVAIVAIAAVVIVALIVFMYVVPRGGRRRRP